MENKGKYRKLSLQDLDVKNDSQTRTHLTTSNNAQREEDSPSLHENAQCKGSKCQAVFQGRVWTAKWQVPVRKGKCQELHSEDIAQGAAGRLQRSPEWVRPVPGSPRLLSAPRRR